jgi:outer membrane protein assembly factor BamA
MNRLFFAHLATIAVCSAVIAQPAAAQNISTEGASQTSAATSQNAPSSSRPGLFQRSVTWVSDKLADGSGSSKDGFYPEVGMVPGAGWLSVGPGYRHHLFGDAAVVSASAAMSTRHYAMMQSQVEWPTLFSNRLSLGVAGKYQDFTQINYFGVGPDSEKSAWSDYRLRSVDVTGTAIYRPSYWLSIGGGAGYIRDLDITPGTSSIHPATHDLFTENTAPGLLMQPRYRHADVFVEADTRDVRGYTRTGGLFRLGLINFQDLSASRQSFRRMDADATQYVPLLRRNWILAVRGHVALSRTGAGNGVPFYMMPTLGGRTTLRGYNDYRFRDRNAAAFAAEYRLPMFRMVDAALFAEAGNVAPTARGLWRERLNHDYGVGLRVHSSTKIFARVDVAKGQEGMRVSAGLSASLGTSRRSVIPYVP